MLRWTIQTDNLLYGKNSLNSNEEIQKKHCLFS